MDTLWVFAVVIGVVAGDVGLGYHYKVPQTSYGVPTYHGGAASSGYNGGAGLGSSNSYNQFGSGVGSGSSYFSGQSGIGQSTIGQSSSGLSSVGQSTTGQSTFGQSTIGQPIIGQSSSDLNSIFGQNTGYLNGFQNAGSSASAIAGADTGSNYYQSGYVQPTYQTGDYSAFNQFQSGQYQNNAADKYQQHYNVIQQQPAQVYKHYYVHAAPEEPEGPKSSQPIVLPPTQKHYKIIFIKAPATPTQAPRIIPVQPQNEEKTIVYVLVKKPEEAQNIVLPKLEQKPPTKPEVFFIKYNNKQDSQAVINNIVSDLNKGSSDATGYSTTGASDQGIASGATAQVFQQGVGLENQGASSFDSSSSIGSTSFGSGSASSNLFGSGLSNSNSFDSSSSAASSSFGSSLGSSNAFAVSDGAKGPTVSVASIDSGSDNNYDAAFGSSISSTASTLTGYDASAISTSQGVPHETYGPPKFKVL